MAAPADTLGEIYVCMGGACQQDGAEATFTEIEELAGSSCSVHQDWCFGQCGAGPNVLVSLGDGASEEVGSATTMTAEMPSAAAWT